MEDDKREYGERLEEGFAMLDPDYEPDEPDWADLVSGDN